MAVNGAVDFENHIFTQHCQENYVQLTLQANVFSTKKKKKGLCTIFLEVAAKNYLYV